MRLNNILMVYFIQAAVNTQSSAEERQRRYLIFTPFSQWGVFVTVSVPLHPETLVSVAWFFEASYYNVDNSTYFEPLLGDIEVQSRTDRRSSRDTKEFLTRRSLYIFIESMLERHGYRRQCLLRAICENASQFLHNGILGDLLHLILTPSTSMSENDIEDYYYEAEYYGLDNRCDYYAYSCPINPIDSFSMWF